MGVKYEASKALAATFVNYLHLGSWINQGITGILSGRKPIEFKSIKDFWQAIYEERLHEGDRIRFKEAFMTEWVPRRPGELWFKHFQGLTRRFDEENGKHQSFSFKPYMHPDELNDTLMSVSGPEEPIGVVRMPLSDNRIRCATMALTTIDYWSCDLSVPVVMSMSVYDSFVRSREPLQSVEADLEGILRFGTLPTLDPVFLSTIKSEQGKTFLQELVTPNGTPSIFLEIVTPLNVKFRTHNDHPNGFLWIVQRRTCISDRALEQYADPVSYIMSTLNFNLGNQDFLQEAIKYFQGGDIPRKIMPQWPDLSKVEIENPLTEKDLYYEHLTEFDGRKKLFPAKIPLIPEPWTQSSLKSEILKTLDDLLKTARINS